MAIPWGDVSTAFHSTGIPNVEVYVPASALQLRLAKSMNPWRWLLAWTPVQLVLKAVAQRRVTGPSAAARGNGTVQLWGEARNAAGQTAQLWMRTPEGYGLTAVAAVRAAEKLLAGTVAPGFHTPSSAFGAGFAGELPGVEVEDDASKLRDKPVRLI
jgi:short subunit dehydrogenase-like uncharacterized protein